MASQDQYQRIELAASDQQIIVLIIWRPGQFSPPHDHGGSQCVFRVLSGIATEQRFSPAGDSCAALVEEDHFLPGSIVSCNGQDIHAMGNDAENAQTLVTLHIYRPRPVMREFSILAGRR